MGNMGRFEYALELATRGWLIFPQHTMVKGELDKSECSCGKRGCSHQAKHPRIKKWQDNATCDAATITEWWTKWPNANIGLKTGKSSGLMVLDLDGEKGVASLRKLEEKFGPLLVTLTSITGRGKHFYFTHPGHLIKHSQEACAEILGPGLEIKADGKADCITAPPSVHVNGHVYKWVDANTPIVAAPNWLLDLLTVEDVFTATQAGDSDDIPEGQRNNRMYVEVCDLFKSGKSQDSILRTALQINQTKCKPPLGEVEIRGMVASVAVTHKPMSTASDRSRSSRNPLFWYAFDVHSFFGDQNVQTLTDFQLGWRTRLMAFAWQSKGYLVNDTDALFELSRASSKPKFKKEMHKALFDFTEVEQDGQSYLVNPGMAQQYAEKMDGWTQKREAGRARAKAKEQEAEKRKTEGLPTEVPQAERKVA